MKKEENTTTPKNIEVGCFVLTSQNKVGYVTETEALIVGFPIKDNEGNETEFSEIERLPAYQWRQANELKDSLQEKQPNLKLEVRNKANSVLLGKSVYQIYSINLKRLNKVRIKLETKDSSENNNYTLVLPAEQAKVVIDILKENRVYHTLF